MTQKHFRARRGMSFREALSVAHELQCTMKKPRRTGELLVAHRLMTKRLLTNSRRKDASLAFVSFLIEVETRLAKVA